MVAQRAPEPPFSVAVSSSSDWMPFFSIPCKLYPVAQGICGEYGMSMLRSTGHKRSGACELQARSCITTTPPIQALHSGITHFIQALHPGTTLRHLQALPSSVASMAAPELQEQEPLSNTSHQTTRLFCSVILKELRTYEGEWPISGTKECKTQPPSATRANATAPSFAPRKLSFALNSCKPTSQTLYLVHHRAQLMCVACLQVFLAHTHLPCACPPQRTPCNFPCNSFMPTSQTLYLVHHRANPMCVAYLQVFLARTPSLRVSSSTHTL
eukprot:1152901-Pelagomonas_calceolata.AAC.26